MNEPACRNEGTCRHSEFCRPGCIPADQIPTIGDIIDRKKTEPRKNSYLPSLFCELLSRLNAPDRGAIVAAVIDYDFHDREPVFLAENLQAAWNAVRADIVRTRENYRKKVEALRTNGKKGGRPRKKATGFEVKPTGFEAEKATGFMPDSSRKGCNYNVITEKNILYNKKNKKGEGERGKNSPDFTKWTPEEFQRQVETAIFQYPEFGTIAEKFTDYWLEPFRTGRPRFTAQKTWDTVRRLRMWANRSFGNTPKPVQTERKIPTLF